MVKLSKFDKYPSLSKEYKDTYIYVPIVDAISLISVEINPYTVGYCLWMAYTFLHETSDYKCLPNRPSWKAFSYNSRSWIVLVLTSMLVHIR